VRLFRRKAMFLVQSHSMAEGLRQLLGPRASVAVMPLHSSVSAAPDEQAHNPGERDIDFIFPSTGDPHKNHRALVLAWARLAQEGVRPSLVVTVDPGVYPNLAEWMAERVGQNDLRITNIGFVPPHEMPSYYRRARALIFPSTCESFGRPLLEAAEFGLPILASELDYVRDVLDPVQTFDPTSPISIARAVKRFLGVGESRAAVCEATAFVAELQRRANESGR
jgi:glycosyltransferase involved in cell wall biosynthesis